MTKHRKVVSLDSVDTFLRKVKEMCSLCRRRRLEVKHFFTENHEGVEKFIL